MTSHPAEFLAELEAALTGRGWTTEKLLDIQVNLLTGGPGPRFAEYTSPEEDLEVHTRAYPGGNTDIELLGYGWKADLAAGRSLQRALAAIDAAHADAAAIAADNPDERSLPELLDAAGWTWSRDTQCQHGTENTWYSPDGTARIRNSLEFLPETGWLLTLAPGFTENNTWTGDDDTPPAVIIALASSSADTTERAAS
ncbi:MAG: hypothetical protein HOW97_02940 [Catenulispora sp.]|nr:hypothetical protein [Catenulispora sp.]